MWTGRQAFERIEKAIMNLHRQETELDSALASATAEAERLRKERNAAFGNWHALNSMKSLRTDWSKISTPVKGEPLSFWSRDAIGLKS